MLDTKNASIKNSSLKILTFSFKLLQDNEWETLWDEATKKRVEQIV